MVSMVFLLWVSYFHPQSLKERTRRPTTAVLISTGKPKANRSTPIIRQQAGRAGGRQGGECFVESCLLYTSDAADE